MPFAGAAYVFERNAGGAGHWGQSAKLIAPDPSISSSFGTVASVGGDTIGVGAPFEPGTLAGGVHVYRRNAGAAGNWGQIKLLTPLNTTTTGAFGSSLSISEDTVLVGASVAAVVGEQSGAAYGFTVDGCVGELFLDRAVPSLTWTDLGAGVEFHVAGGDLSEMRSSQNLDGTVCLHIAAEPRWDDPRVAPESGDGYYYLMRALDSCGSGNYGSASAGTLRPEIDCP